MVRWFKVIRSALLIIGGRPPLPHDPVRLLPAISYDATDTSTAVIRQTLNSFPTRTAPDALPTDPVLEDVGPSFDRDDVVLGPPKSVLAALK